MTGICTSFNSTLGYGFCSSESDGVARFFHHTNIIGERPVRGCRVTFDAVTTPKGPAAVNVQVSP